MYKYFNERLPKSFNDILVASKPNKCLRLERPIGKVFEQFPKCFLSEIWNS